MLKFGFACAFQYVGDLGSYSGSSLQAVINWYLAIRILGQRVGTSIDQRTNSLHV